MAMYGGTTQKRKTCAKTVCVVDQLTAGNEVFHRAYFGCRHCRGPLKLSDYHPWKVFIFLLQASFRPIAQDGRKLNQEFGRGSSIEGSFQHTTGASLLHIIFSLFIVLCTIALDYKK